jgi:hypothetical protein
MLLYVHRREMITAKQNKILKMGQNLYSTVPVGNVESALRLDIFDECKAIFEIESSAGLGAVVKKILKSKTL